MFGFPKGRTIRKAVEDLPRKILPPWFPITDQKDLSRLGKALEEASELQEELAQAQLQISKFMKIGSRCIIQGLDEFDPDTLVKNRDKLQNEISDLRAQCKRLVKKLGLNEEEMAIREEHKLERMEDWEFQLDHQQTKRDTC